MSASPELGAGVFVVGTDGHGLSLAASRAFAPGEVVLDEAPRFLLVEEANGVDAELLAAVCAATGRALAEELPRTLAAVLSLWLRLDLHERDAMGALFCTPDAPGLAELCASIAAAVAARIPRLRGADPTQLGGALCAWLLSSHETFDAESGRAGAAIFQIGHRCNHSCEPNVAYLPVHSHRLSLRALRPIAAGEPVVCSYLRQPELLMPRGPRRALLAARKSFCCGCARCATADDAEPERRLPCAATGCGGTTALAGGGVWRCGGCGSDAPPSAKLLAREAELCERALREEAEEGGADDDGAGAIEPDGGPLGAAWEGHWVHCAALWRIGIRELRAALAAGDARGARAAAPRLAAHFAWARAAFPHAPNFASARAAEAFACLRAAAEALGDAEAGALAVRLCAAYLPALEAEYGAADVHNAAMRAFCAGRCAACGRGGCAGCGAPAIGAGGGRARAGALPLLPSAGSIKGALPPVTVTVHAVGPSPDWSGA